MASLGPYFAVELHRLGHQPAAPWRPMTELVDRPKLLLLRVESVRQFLAAGSGLDPRAIQWRVAASTVHLGLVARLLSPTLATTVLTGRAPDPHLTEFFWQPTLGGLYPLSLPEPSEEVRGGGVAGDLLTWLTTGPVERLTRAMRAAGGVSAKVLRGNVASALHGAAQQIVTARPDLRDRTAALLDAVGNEPPLRGTGRVLPSGGFRRNSCCLIYRAAAPRPMGAARAVCSDCVLAAD